MQLMIWWKQNICSLEKRVENLKEQLSKEKERSLQLSGQLKEAHSELKYIHMQLKNKEDFIERLKVLRENAGTVHVADKYLAQYYKRKEPTKGAQKTTRESSPTSQGRYTVPKESTMHQMQQADRKHQVL